MLLGAQGAGAQPLPLRGVGFWDGGQIICFVMGDKDRIKDCVSNVCVLFFFIRSPEHPFSLVSNT